MLSVGSREDARKGLGLGVGHGGSREMEENELEEGEACSIQEDDAPIDPDVALSYIDEKIQDVLGHFQKDFEGVVSAENLGAKFGAYGSFLPTYQRSPSIWSHPRSPQRAPNHNTPKSPYNLPVEAAHQKVQNPAVATSTPVPLRNNSASKSLPVDGTKKNETFISTPNFRDDTLQHDLANITSKCNDQKILKVRIKVGSDNVLPKPNATIYSDMGLEYSPSLSMSQEDSPGTSGEFSAEPRDASHESPMTIYQIMTCFPVPGGYVLSPLPESLLHLMEYERPYQKDSKLTIHKTGVEIRDVLLDESLSSRDVKVSSGKKAKPVRKNVKSSEVRSVDSKGRANDVTGIQKNGIDMAPSVVKELVSNALDNSILPSSRDADDTEERHLHVEAVKDGGTMREPNKVMSKFRDVSPDLAKDEPLVDMANSDTRKVSNPGNGFLLFKGKHNLRGSSDKALEEGKTSKHKNASVGPHMECGVKYDKNHDPFKFEDDRLEVKKDVAIESDDQIKVKGLKGSTLHEQSSEKMLQSKDHSSGSRGNSGSQANGMPPLALPKENSKAVSSVPSKEKKKSSHSKIDHSENKRNTLGPNKESNRIICQEGHKDAVGDAKFERTGKRTDPIESTFRDKAKDFRIEHEKNIFSSAEKIKESLVGKKVQNPPLSEAFGKNSEITPMMANGPTSDVAPATSTHVVIEEHWVCCDRCQKWRLLPYGTNPDHLPKKWLCTMLNWLPGMNKCSISEEETTRALHALYQAPPPENHTASGPNTSYLAAFADAQHTDPNHEPGLHMASIHGKKKHTQKDSSHVAHSVKKNQQASVKSRSLNDVNQIAPHSSSNSSFQHVSRSTELNVEKDNDRQKEKHKVEQYVDRGEFVEHSCKSSKSKNKRDFDQDSFRTSKKVKAEGILCVDEDWHSDHDLSGRLAAINHNGMLPKVMKKSSIKDDGNSSFKSNSQDSLSVSRKKMKPHTQVSSNGYSTFDDEKFVKEPSAKKRKVKERQDSFVHPEIAAEDGLLMDNRVNVKEEISESESRKEKKSRVSKVAGSDSVAIMVDEKIDKKGRPMKVLLPNSRKQLPDRVERENKGMAENEQKGQYKGGLISERNMDCLDCLKTDLACAHPPTAATSSSSKVSGTRRSKSNFQEGRGSPVESVSSSPLRISNTDKLSNRKNWVGKDEDKAYEVTHCGSLDVCRPAESGFRDPAKGMPDCRDKEEPLKLVGKGEGGMHLKVCNNVHDDIPSSEFEENYPVTGALSTSVQHNKYHDDIWGKNHGHDVEKLNKNRQSSSSAQRKSGKSSSQPREKHKSSKSDISRGKIKISASLSEREDICSAKDGNGARYDADMDSRLHSTYHEDIRDAYNRLEKKDEKKRGSTGRQSSECRRDNHLSFAKQENVEADHLLSKQHKSIHSKDNQVGTMSTKGGKPYLEDNPHRMISQEDVKPSNNFPLDRTEKLETADGRGKTQLPSHSVDKLEPPIRDPRTILADVKGDRSEALTADAVAVEATKVPKQSTRLDRQNGPHYSSLRHPTPNGLDAPSPIRRDSNQSVSALVLKEARDLKHTANRLKSEGRESESTGLYFEAALKFLHVAFLLETESGKHGESAQSIMMYSDTARLCEFCAHEYEKRKEMAAAALVYKCMEVAYMKVVFFKHPFASKDRHELRTAVQVVHTDESPSSSASDVDNLNTLGAVDKAAPTKGASSPQVTGNHVITARNRPNFARLLNFVQDVNSAMEASRKSQCAFTAVNSSPEELHYAPEIIASVRRVLDLSFHDVEGLLRLVRLSMDSISR